MGLIAAAVLAIACIGAGTFLLLKILHLTENGQRAEARVVAIERDAKSSKWPVYEFTTETGLEVRARDITQLMFAPVGLGDTVTVFYDPADPFRVVADLGRWLWRGPVVFFTASLLFIGLSAAIFVYSDRRDRSLP